VKWQHFVFIIIIIIIIILILFFFHGLGRLTCSGIDALHFVLLHVFSRIFLASPDWLRDPSILPYDTGSLSRGKAARGVALTTRPPTPV
jgi:hypothetical protein